MQDTQLTTFDPTSSSVPAAMIFVSDQDSEGVIRLSLNDIGIGEGKSQFTTGNVQTATAALAKSPSPRLLIVDISGVEQPGKKLGELAKVCEPKTSVIVIGDENDIRLYRDLKAAGITEYFFKPLVRNIVVQTCNNVLTGTATVATSRTGRLVFMLGVRGGVGATTIAVTTAWNVAEVHKRWAMLLDLDLYAGDAALQLDSKPGHALTEALNRPERVDELFLERGATHITSRLDLLAALEPLNEDYPVEENAVLSLLSTLLHRYRFVVVDVPPTVASRLPHMLRLPSLCLLISTGTLAAARDTARWREQLGPNTSERTTLHLLNHGGARDAIPLLEFSRVTGGAPDFIVPYMHEVEKASIMGIKGLQGCPGLQRTLAPMFRQLTGEGEQNRLSLLARLFT
jgi:pilus assembly protein CpaE